MKFGIRDIPATIIGAASGIGLAGVAAKKFIAADDSFAKKFVVGISVSVLTGGTALLPFLIAKPGQETKAELAAARAQVVQNRYD